ncbi:forkhead box protein O6-like [Amphibalanus amphitrite]|uniref:forkhead box protein O6-like n=1 Tax=Amphibalanus amphitrite TaxID=1232801 RepID=UPI001C9237EA|nr:forkhead box protein O6-like [Amphibalanus amphitrite]
MWKLVVLLVAVGSVRWQSGQAASYPPPGAPKGSDPGGPAPYNKPLGEISDSQSRDGGQYDGSSYSSSSSSSSSSSAGSQLSFLSPDKVFAIRRLSESIRLHTDAAAAPFYPDFQPGVPAPPHPGPGWIWPAGPQYWGASGTRYNGNAGTSYPGNGGTYYSGNGDTRYSGASGTRHTANGGTTYSGNVAPYYPGPYQPAGAVSGPRNSRAPGAAGADSAGDEGAEEPRVGTVTAA